MRSSTSDLVLQYSNTTSAGSIRDIPILDRAIRPSVVWRIRPLWSYHQLPGLSNLPGFALDALQLCVYYITGLNKQLARPRS